MAFSFCRVILVEEVETGIMEQATVSICEACPSERRRWI